MPNATSAENAIENVTIRGLLVVGFGAAGTVGNREERDYHYGAIPEGLLSLRLIAGELAMLEASGRQYHVIGTGSKGGPAADTFGREVINCGIVGLTVRLFGPHAIGLRYVVSSRNAG